MGAAEEIARQLRLRDIGGIIVIDFIDMGTADHRQKLYEKMCELMRPDRAKHNILPLSKFGLMQITRQRVRPAMDVIVDETCPTCHGKGVIKSSYLFTDVIESKIDHIVNILGMRKFQLFVHPYVFAYINQGFPSLKMKWHLKYGLRFKITPSQSLAFLQYEFKDKAGNLIDMQEEIEQNS
jgi:ribonuclease G